VITLSLLISIGFALPLIGLSIFAAYKWRGGKYLCDDCQFNSDTDCQKPDRPKAIVCFAYRKKG
jgi:hypothetical protein